MGCDPKANRTDSGTRIPRLKWLKLGGTVRSDRGEHNDRGLRKKMNDHSIPLSSSLFQCCTDLVNFGFHLALFIQPSCGMPSQTGIQWLINAGHPLHNLSPSLTPSLLPSFIFSYGASKFWVIPTMQYISMSHEGNHISLFKCNIKIK